MTKVATRWKAHRFEQMARLINDRVDDPANSGVERYVGLEHLDPESLRIRRWGEVSDVESTKLRFQTGDIIFGKRRVYQRKVAVADFEGICSAHAMVLRANSNVVLPAFLPFFMQSEGFMERALEISVGSLSPTINWGALAKEEFELPTLDEQQRMVRALRAADDAWEKLRNLWSATTSVLTALAAEVFSESSWPEHQLSGLLIYASDGPFGSKIKTEHYAEFGARVIRLNNIDENRFNDEDRAFLSIDYFNASLKSHEVRPGDVVIAGLGDERIRAGRACVVPNNLGPAVNKADCFCLRPGPRLLPQFLAFFLNSPRGLAQSEAYSQGTTRSRLNLANIKKMTIPLPSVAVQKKIGQMMGHLLERADETSARSGGLIDVRKQLLSKLMERPPLGYRSTELQDD